MALETVPSQAGDGLAILEHLGFTPVINAAGTPSRLGGSVLSAPVRAAMDAAAQHFVPIAEMQDRASEVIAATTGSEAGCVASGASACLFLAAAACITGVDPAAIDQLPDTTGLRDQLVVHRAHRNPFDHALRGSGARFVEFGYLGLSSGVGAYRWQLEAAITERAAAVVYAGQPSPWVLPLRTVVEVAHQRGVPVIVDGAGTLPPSSNLQSFIAAGADLVAFSGGKIIDGPGASGFLAGRRDLIRAAMLHQQDAFAHPGLWEAPLGRSENGADLWEPPHQGLGRAMKVGREEIAGLMVALEEYARRDHNADMARWHSICRTVADGLAGIEAIKPSVITPGGGQVPYVVLALASPARALSTASALQSGNPRVFVSPMRAGDGELVIFPQNVRSGEPEALVERLREVVLSGG